MFDRVLVLNSEKSGQFVSTAEIAALSEKGATVTSSVSDALKSLESIKFYFPVLVTASYSNEAQKFLLGCTKHLGSLPDNFVIVSNDPDPRLQGIAYENGVRNLWSSENLVTKLGAWLETLEAKIKAEGSQENVFFKLGVLVARAKKGNKTSDIAPLIAKLKPETAHDYRIAYLLGHASLVTQQFDDAESFFKTCMSLNPKYVPATIAHAQLRLQNAAPNEAFQMLLKLEKLNNANSERKALLAAACADAGNWEGANQYLLDAEKLEPDNSRVKEMKVRVAFESGNVQEALRLLEKCDVIDEYFVTKLNDQAIALSKTGRTQDALSLYQKAHAIASPHIKFKISFNIALAYKRQNDFAKALEVLDLLDKEVGDEGFEKATKLRQQIKEEMTKS